jgi:hypothetical protein
MDILSNDKFWTILGSFFTMIAGIAAMIAVIQSRRASKDQMRSNRPYVSLLHPELNQWTVLINT